MKNLIFFLLIMFSACNKNPFNPTKYQAVTSADMVIVAEKMRQEILPKASKNSYYKEYYAEAPDKLSKAELALLLSPTDSSDVLFIRIGTKTPGQDIIVVTSSSGKIISAYGYPDDVISSDNFYSELRSYPTSTKPEAINFYFGLQRAVVDYIRNYKKL